MEKITKQQIPVLVARLVEFQEQLASMSREDAQWAILNSKEAIRLFTEAVENRTKEENPKKILSLIPTGRLIIEALPAGQATIAQAKETFSAYIDSDFENWDLDKEQVASEETPVDIYELKQNATFKQIFKSLNSDLNKLCLTQSQIVRFCKKHKKDLVQKGGATFFLFKENNKFFVAGVSVHSVGLSVGVYRFEHGVVWGAAYAHRLVVPATKIVA